MMRRRTNAGLTALQAALSGIGGGFAGYAKDTETRKADAERERLQRESERLQREREEERTYSREMGLAGLLQQGFTTPEQLATRRAAAGPDVANYVSQSVRSMMPGSTAAPPDPTLMQRVLDTTGGDFREGQRLTIGGRELVLPESTPQRQDRLAALARGEARNAAQVAAQQRAKDAEDRERLARINNQPASERILTPQQRYDSMLDRFINEETQVLENVPDPLGIGPGTTRTIRRPRTPEEVRTFRALLEKEILGKQSGVGAQANGAATPNPSAGPALGGGGRAGGGDDEARARAWMRQNPRQGGESSNAYAARMRAAVGGER